MHDLDMLCEGMPPFLNKVAVLSLFTIFGVNLYFMTHLGWLPAPYPKKKLLCKILNAGLVLPSPLQKG